MAKQKLSYKDNLAFLRLCSYLEGRAIFPKEQETLASNIVLIRLDKSVKDNFRIADYFVDDTFALIWLTNHEQERLYLSIETESGFPFVEGKANLDKFKKEVSVKIKEGKGKQLSVSLASINKQFSGIRIEANLYRQIAEVKSNG